MRSIAFLMTVIVNVLVLAKARILFNCPNWFERSAGWVGKDFSSPACKESKSVKSRAFAQEASPSYAPGLGFPEKSLLERRLKKSLRE